MSIFSMFIEIDILPLPNDIEYNSSVTDNNFGLWKSMELLQIYLHSNLLQVT